MLFGPSQVSREKDDDDDDDDDDDTRKGTRPRIKFNNYCNCDKVYLFYSF